MTIAGSRTNGVEIFGIECGSGYGSGEGIKSVSEILDKIQKLEAEYQVYIQLLDADKVCGKKHLEVAVMHTVRAFARGENLSKKFGIELLRFAGAVRQLKDGITKMGIKEGMSRIAVVVYYSPTTKTTTQIDKTKLKELETRLVAELRGVRNDAILNPSHQKLINFGITESELKNLMIAVAQNPYKLVFERMAFVNIL